MASKGQFKLLTHGDCYPCKSSENYSYVAEKALNNIDKELSKSLVPSTLEGGFKESKMIKATKSNCALSALTYALLFSLFVWLLALTFVREMQISKIRNEIENLKADIEKMRHKLPDDALNDLNLFEDAIYTELDMAGRENGQEAAARGTRRGSLETREDDDEDDDADDAYSESGDWSYHDYDKNRATIDDTDDAIIAVESDFLGAVMETPQAPTIRKIVEMPEENKSSEDGRGKRETMEPLLPLEEQFVDMSFLDDASRYQKYGQRKLGLDRTKMNLKAQKRFEKLKVMNKDVNVRDSRDIDETEESVPSLVAAHYGGDTSHLTLGRHENYEGNGRLHLPHEATHAAWRAADWLTAIGADHHLQLEPAGTILVKTPGLYFLYVQIFYHDPHDTSGWVVEVDGVAALQCAAGRGGAVHTRAPASCYSARALPLTVGQRLRARNASGSRAAIMTPEKSFIGLVKLANLPSF